MRTRTNWSRVYISIAQNQHALTKCSIGSICEGLDIRLDAEKEMIKSSIQRRTLDVDVGNLKVSHLPMVRWLREASQLGQVQ